MRKIQELGNTRYIFVSNDRQLMQALAAFREPRAVLLWNDHDSMEMYQLEIVRLLHNYLASSNTLVDHTRVLVEDLYRKTDFWKEYEAKKKEIFVDSQLAQFVKRLRNYMLHSVLPFTSTTMRFKKGQQSDLDCFVNLDLTKLRLWDGWTSKAREYLNCPEDRVRLDELAMAYTGLVTDFYDWFDKRQHELHYKTS